MQAEEAEGGYDYDDDRDYGLARAMGRRGGKGRTTTEEAGGGGADEGYGGTTTTG